VTANRVDPRTPVIIGVGQLTNRVDRGDPALEPVDMIVEAARRAAIDCGRPDVGAQVDSIRVVSLLSWRYRDPAALVAARLGATPRETVYTGMGGNTPQSLVNQTCREIAESRNDLVIIGGAEAWRTRMATRAVGDRPAWTVEPDDTPTPRMVGEDVPMTHPAETARGVLLPVQVYPLFEQALRHQLGRPMADHLVAVSELWSRFSAVAAGNPYAWIQRAHTAEEIRTPSADNRVVGFPYTKVMNSNNAVEQSAAVIICSAECAAALGVARDRWVFPVAGTDAHDTYAVSERGDLASSPAIRVAGRRLFELARCGIDDVGHVDLYSCFPSAVQIAARELGLGTERQLTVTGGMSFAGGPWNNYVTHAIATMVDVLRNDPGALGLCTANGGHVTKHALGLYSTEPPANGFLADAPQSEVDAHPRRDVCDEHDGEVTVESWTVMFDREGSPENGIAACLLDDGRRAWGTTQDSPTLETMTTEDLIGHRAHLDRTGTLAL
jgi:acetyl-CoA C-acetyltransferase